MQHAYDEQLATNRYFDRKFGLEAAKILPGEYFVSSKEALLVTVLGSCVAACIRDADSGIGGMNHFMLPDDGGRNRMGMSARYGTYAMEVLINHLLKLGARRNRLEAKVFGGGVCAGFSEDGKNPGSRQGPARFVPAKSLLFPALGAGSGQEIAQGAQRNIVQSRKRLQGTVKRFQH